MFSSVLILYEFALYEYEKKRKRKASTTCQNKEKQQMLVRVAYLRPKIFKIDAAPKNFIRLF